MMIWLAIAVMCGAAMAGLAAPLLRRGAVAVARADFDREVFRDQLAELDRDAARGMIGAVEAVAARNEISRRLLQTVSGAAKPVQTGGIRLGGLVAVLLIPAVAIPLYALRGNPRLGDVALSTRLESAVQNQDFDAMIAKVERHLAEQPDDLKGWTVLAPAYKRLQRWDDAASAYGQILRLSKPDAEVIADYGEMVVFGSEGMVSAEASRAFREALKLDPTVPKARYYMALSMKQEGRNDEARTALQALLRDTPADAPWRATVAAELQDTGSAPALTQEQIAAGAGMKQGDQQAMIRSMVDGLETKLASNGDDLEGWLRLIRARVVLGEPDKAKVAYATAKTRFAQKPEAVGSLDGLASELAIR